MRDHTIDQALIELARTMKALRALRKRRQDMYAHTAENLHFFDTELGRYKAAAERAALDCRYKLADLRAGR